MRFSQKNWKFYRGGPLTEAAFNCLERALPPAKELLNPSIKLYWGGPLEEGDELGSLGLTPTRPIVRSFFPKHQGGAQIAQTEARVLNQSITPSTVEGHSALGWRGDGLSWDRLA